MGLQARNERPDSVFQYNGPDFNETLSFYPQGVKYKIKYKDGSKPLACEGYVINHFSTDSISVYECGPYRNVHPESVYSASMSYEKLPFARRYVYVCPAIPFTLTGITDNDTIVYKDNIGVVEISHKIDEIYVTFASCNNKKHLITSEKISINKNHNVMMLVLNDRKVIRNSRFIFTDLGIIPLHNDKTPANYVMKRIR